MSGKQKFPRAVALDVARELCQALQPHCARLIVAGSLRRMRPEVGDVEILFVPRFAEVQADFFQAEKINLASQAVEALEKSGVLTRRFNVNGSQMWGTKNKLALHVRTGVPVDLFETNEASWFNYLVCRTGGAETNKRIAMAAQQMGWTWNPYGPGFSRASGLGREERPMASERDVFEFVGLTYLEPSQRA